MIRKLLNQRLWTLVLLASVAATACKPQAPAEPAATAEPARTEAVAEQPAPPVAIESTPAASPADVPFDIKAFAGTFSGTLPCADCPGIDTKVTLVADGSYKLHEAHQGKPVNGFDSDGTWTVEENGTRIRLDPNSKSERDRLFAVTSKDQIDGLDLEGKAPENKLSYALKREDAAQ